MKSEEVIKRERVCKAGEDKRKNQKCRKGGSRLRGGRDTSEEGRTRVRRGRRVISEWRGKHQ